MHYTTIITSAIVYGVIFGWCAMFLVTLFTRGFMRAFFFMVGSVLLLMAVLVEIVCFAVLWQINPIGCIIGMVIAGFLMFGKFAAWANTAEERDRQGSMPGEGHSKRGEDNIAGRRTWLHVVRYISTTG